MIGSLQIQMTDTLSLKVPALSPLCTPELSSPRIFCKDSKKNPNPLRILSVHDLIEPFLFLLCVFIKFLGILMRFHGL